MMLPNLTSYGGYFFSLLSSISAKMLLEVEQNDGEEEGWRVLVVSSGRSMAGRAFLLFSLIIIVAGRKEKRGGGKN